jgi:hypothetical protein
MVQEEIRVPPRKENTSVQTDDYISVSSIRNAILDFFRFFFKGFDLIFLSVRKRVWLFILCCLLGVLGAVAYRYFIPRYHRTAMIVYYNDLSKKDYYEIIGNLNSLLMTQSYDYLARELKIKEDEARNVKGIEAINLNGESLDKDTTTKIGQRFKIELRLKENVNPIRYQTAILNYLNNNPYLKELKEGQKKVYSEKLEFINREQQRLDSLKSYYNNNLGTAKMPSTFYNNELNPADIYVQSNNLANQKEIVRTWLQNQAVPVMLVDGFKAPTPSQTLSSKVIVAIGLLIGIVLGLIICLLASIRDVVRL